MKILFLKSADLGERRDITEDDGDEALEKIRAIFILRAKEAKTKDEREHAERELQKIETPVQDSP